MELYKRELIAKIEAAINDEISARDGYRSLFERLQDGGYYEEARQVNLIADAEDGHANTLMTILQTIKGEPEEIKLSGEMVEVPLGRPVPETYSDWVNLGMDIKEKAGIDDIKTTAEVNEHLYHIWKEEEDPATAQVSKRWLTEKARELGIT